MTNRKVVDRLALLVFVLLCWPFHTCLAQNPADDQGNPRLSQPCVLLQNDNVLFGRAYQVGEYVVVQTGHGGEVQLSRKEVSCWANSLHNLYQYRVDTRQQGDIAAHLRDARWCLQYDLFDFAAQEIEVVLKIDPENVAVKSIQDQLNRQTKASEKESTRPKVTAAGIPVVQPVGYRGEITRSIAGTVDPLSLRGFASHVQPMLLNRCGRCHSSDSQRGWTIIVPSSGARASSQITHANLSSSLLYLDRASPVSSQLLVKATTAHGGDEAQLSPRNAKAIESLKRWIAMTVNSMPPASSDSPPSYQPIQQPDAGSRRMHAPAAEFREARVTMGDHATPYHVPPSGPQSTQAKGQPARLPQVENPFDPDLFNRRFQIRANSQ